MNTQPSRGLTKVNDCGAAPALTGSFKTSATRLFSCRMLLRSMTGGSTMLIEYAFSRIVFCVSR